MTAGRATPACLRRGWPGKCAADLSRPGTPVLARGPAHCGGRRHLWRGQDGPIPGGRSVASERRWSVLALPSNSHHRSPCGPRPRPPCRCVGAARHIPVPVLVCSWTSCPCFGTTLSLFWYGEEPPRSVSMRRGTFLSPDLLWVRRETYCPYFGTARNLPVPSRCGERHP